MNKELTTLDQAKNTVVDLAIKFGPKVLAALLILFLGVLISRWVGRAVLLALRRVEMEPPVRILLIRVVRLVVFAVFVIMSLQNLGIELLPLIAGLGVAGAGIALALQGVLSNAAAGLTIIFTKPFRVGEYISIIGEEGRVEAITLFNTTLAHPDLSYIVVPNRKIVGEVLHNYGKIRQLNIGLQVALEANVDEVLSIAADVVSTNARMLKDPRPLIRVAGLSGSTVMIEVKPWAPVMEYNAAIGEIAKSLAVALKDRGVEMPYQSVQLLQASSAR
jgi:small conductance mechanosensitive channel